MIHACPHLPHPAGEFSLAQPGVPPIGSYPLTSPSPHREPTVNCRTLPVAAALSGGEARVKGFTEEHQTLIGSGRVYQPQARISPDGSGTLFYCVDEGKGSTKDLKTGRVTGTPANEAKVFYQTKLKKSGDGI